MPIITTGDLRSIEAGNYWGDEAIYGRLDDEGVPIVIAGWPCDGDSAQNKKATGLDHPSTSLVIDLSRIVNVVYEYMNSPRMSSERRMHALSVGHNWSGPTQFERH